MYISRIELKNIRCFKKLKLKLNRDSKPILWTTLLGDNSTGKTTLLRSIAIGLCDESSAAGLLRESEEGYISNEAKGNGEIKITLSDYEGNDKGTITTTIESVKKNGSRKVLFEKLRQQVNPPDFNPWGDIFICGYGIGRGVSGTGDITGYSPISAVYNLFNYSEGLQNPELVIRRINKDVEESKQYEEIIRILRSVLNLQVNSKIEVESDGIKIEGGPWKTKMPLRDLADGYQSMFQWITDLCGWLVSFNAGKETMISQEFSGIVLVDAIEEHLHPKWQRTLVKTLHENLFKKLQFIVATHSPLIASATVDYDDTYLVELELNEDSFSDKNEIDHNELKGLRADQVLRHDAFGLNATASIGSMDDMDRYLELESIKKPTKEQKSELADLKKTTKESYVFGENEFEREVEKAVIETLTKMIKYPTDKHFIEVKKQLQEIFKKQ